MTICELRKKQEDYQLKKKGTDKDIKINSNNKNRYH